MDPITIGAIIGGAEGAGQLISGIFQKSKAKKIARKNIRPVYDIQQPILDNQALAESRASEGLSDSAKQAYTTNADRGISASIDAILKGGGTVNNIADIYDTYQSGIGKMALVDEEMRAKNIKELITQNNTLAAEKDKQWQVNTFAPYADKAQAAAVLSKQGSDNIWKGINTIGSTAMSALEGKMYKKEGDDVFKTTNPSEPSATGATAAQAGAAAGINNASTTTNLTGVQMGMAPISIDGVLYDAVTMKPLN